jgi:hypothetical protein
MHDDVTTSPAAARLIRGLDTENRCRLASIAGDPIARRNTIRITQQQIGKTSLLSTLDPAQMLFLDLGEAGLESASHPAAAPRLRKLPRGVT